MENLSLQECIRLIKNGEKVDARKLLQGIIRNDLNNLNAWYWYAETFDIPEEKLKALRLCLKYNPDNSLIKNAIQNLELSQPKPTEKNINLMAKQKTGSKQMQPSRAPKKNGLNATTRMVLILGLLFGILTLFSSIGFVFLFQEKVTPFFASSPTPHATSTKIPKKTPTPKPFTGKWQSAISKSPFDGSNTVVLALDADTSVQGWLRKTLPTLVLRCQEGEIDAIVKLYMFAETAYGSSSAVDVRVRFDNNPPMELVADESTDEDDLFFRAPQHMIIAMLRSREMVLGFTPFNADPVVTTFDVRGLSNVIEPLKTACSWNGETPTKIPVPTATLTATPLPSGSVLTIDGVLESDKWNISVDKIIVTNTISGSRDSIKAGGRFFILFLNVTNIGNDPSMFNGSGNIRIKGADGTIYDEEFNASFYVTEQYNLPIGRIQPGDSALQIVVFDVLKESQSYFLVPGSLANNNGQSIILDIK